MTSSLIKTIEGTKFALAWVNLDTLKFKLIVKAELDSMLVELSAKEKER